MEQKKDAFDYNIFVRFVKFMFAGLKYAKYNKYVLIFYLILIALTLLELSMTGDCTPTLTLDFLGVLSVSIYLYWKEKPIRRMRNYFFKVFSQMRFETKEGDFPVYLYDEYISEYELMIKFYSMIPLTEWNKKIEILEMHMNEKISRVEYDKHDKRKINLMIQKKELPEYIEWNEQYIDYSNNVLNIGVSYQGVEGIDLERYPHSFIAGETGSGKSNILKCLIYQSYKKGYEIELVDFKRGVSFANFSNVIQVHSEYNTVLKVFKSAVEETNKRLDMFKQFKVDNIKDHNKISNNKLKRKIIFIDELAELLKTRDKEISAVLYECIETLTRISRAVGIHLIMGIQRPDSTIVNGQIKNNVSFRLCGRFVDPEPSRIMLNNDMASKIPNIKGRFIMRTDEMINLQAFCYHDVEISDIKEEFDIKALQGAIQNSVNNAVLEIHSIKPAKEVKPENNTSKQEKALNVAEDVETDGKKKDVPTNIEFDFSDID